jgi:hypothetical protein
MLAHLMLEAELWRFTAPAAPGPRPPFRWPRLFAVPA